jgi:hypothetical protein
MKHACLACNAPILDQPYRPGVDWVCLRCFTYGPRPGPPLAPAILDASQETA